MKRIAIILFCLGGALSIFVGVAFGVFSTANPKDRLPFTADGPPSVAKNIDGRSWELRSYDANGQKTCIQNTVPGEAIGTTCLPTSQVFAGGRDLLVLPGARQKEGTARLLKWDNIWINGLASPRVARLTVVLTDCSTESVDIGTDGAFLYVAPTAKVHNDVVPHRVLAIGKSGRLLDSETFDVGVPKRAKEAGLSSPKPRNACA